MRLNIHHKNCSLVTFNCCLHWGYFGKSAEHQQKEREYVNVCTFLFLSVLLGFCDGGCIRQALSIAFVISIIEGRQEGLGGFDFVTSILLVCVSVASVEDEKLLPNKIGLVRAVPRGLSAEM